MNRLILLSIYFFLFAFVSISESANWVYFGSSIGSGDEHFYDSTSIVLHERGVASVWTKLIYKKPKEYLKFLKEQGFSDSYIMQLKTLHSAVVLEAHNCFTREFQFRHITYYDSKLRLLMYYTYSSSESEWQPVMPRSLGEALFKIVCKDKQ